MTYPSALKINLSHSNALFGHRNIDNLLFEKKTENEIFSINFPEGKVIFDGIRAGDKTVENSRYKIKKKKIKEERCFLQLNYLTFKTERPAD
ncbi:hypothetical protein OA530_01495 [Pelagibacteraceae bacterium]|nr:hypothetical protein [Pelagibacteraceae bacterium]